MENNFFPGILRPKPDYLNMRQLSVIHGDSEWHEGLLLHRHFGLSAIEVGFMLRLNWWRWRQRLFGLCFRITANPPWLVNLYNVCTAFLITMRKARPTIRTFRLRGRSLNRFFVVRMSPSLLCLECTVVMCPFRVAAFLKNVQV